jgi:hypothetical protein
MSLPWPALLVLTWSATHSAFWLGVVGAARLAPYLVISWAAGALGDRMPRLRLVRISTGVRVVLLAAAALLVAGDHLAVAVVASTLAVAAGTPAYPALAAAMPGLAGRSNDRATSLLVTVEVSAFVVGPAVCGLVLGPLGETGSVALAAVLAAAGSLLLVGVPGVPSPRSQAVAAQPRLWTALRGVVPVIGAVAGVNFVIGAGGVALLPLAERAWSAGEVEFGLATAALGFGALAAPLLRSAVPTVGRALVLTGVPLVVAALTPGVAWGLLPLALVGAAATHVECEVTGVIQRSVPDQARAFALGVTDCVMVAAALLGALLAPWLSDVFGAPLFLGACGLATAAMAVLDGRSRSAASPAASAAGRETPGGY